MRRVWTTALLARMTDEAAQNAGVHLDRCVAAKPPARAGKPVTDKDVLTTAARISGMENTVAQDTQDKTVASAPAEWCAEEPVKDAAYPVLLWHAVDASGMVLPADRAMLMTAGPPVIVESRADGLVASVFPTRAKGGTLYAETVVDGDNRCFFGLFDGGPDGTAAANILSGLIRDTVHPKSCFNLKTKQVTVYMKSDPQP